jgi:hypothetical protein
MSKSSTQKTAVLTHYQLALRVDKINYEEKKLKKIFSFVILIVGFLNACSSPAQTPSATPPSVVLPTSTKTSPTVAPPKANPPTVVPPTARPLFFDDFSNKQAVIDTGWYLGGNNAFGWTWSPKMLKGYASKGEAWTANGTGQGYYESDYAIQVQAQPTSAGYVEYGIYFRAISNESKNYYVFTITTDRKYAFAEFGKGNNGKDNIPYTTSTHIHTNSANTLGVMADGNQISLYINGFQVANLTDVSITRGTMCGLFVRSSRKERAEAGFSQFTVLTVEQAQKGGLDTTP